MPRPNRYNKQDHELLPLRRWATECHGHGPDVMVEHAIDHLATEEACMDALRYLLRAAFSEEIRKINRVEEKQTRRYRFSITHDQADEMLMSELHAVESNLVRIISQDLTDKFLDSMVPLGDKEWVRAGSMTVQQVTQRVELYESQICGDLEALAVWRLILRRMMAEGVAIIDDFVTLGIVRLEEPVEQAATA